MHDGTAADEQVATWPATRLAGAIRDREISSRELLELYLRRIEGPGAPLNAVVTLDAERARAAAAVADEATAQGRVSGPLHGLPITVKDAIETAGVRSTGGAPELRDHVPAADAPAVARLRAAGAVVFGKTNLPRWSMDIQSFNDVFGTTSNPWDTTRTPGGSSGGAAAAVAAGLTSFELGTDIGGSIRLPSHFCGVFGLKPSYGLVPQRGYLDHAGGGSTDADINVFGPIARSAADLDLLLGVLAGPPPDQAPAWRVDLPGPRPAGATGLRVGTWLDDPACPVDTECLGLLRSAAAQLERAGAVVDEARPSVSFDEQIGVYLPLIVAATSASLPDAVAEVAAGSHRAWLRLEEARAGLRARWAQWFEDHDVLLCPVSATAAFAHDQAGDLMERLTEVNGEIRPVVSTSMWCGLIGVVGLPSAVVPIGTTAGGLPIGIQVVAPYLHDRRAVQVAGILAEMTGGYRPPPGF